MKVYKSYVKNKEIPEIKIKNQLLNNSGFNIGSKFKVKYKNKKIILKIYEKKEKKF